jgi:hypothetical protein
MPKSYSSLPPSLPKRGKIQILVVHRHTARNGRKQMIRIGVALCAFWFSTLAFAETTGPLLLRNPGVSSTEITFAFAGDIWTVPRDGGAAKRLTTGPGVEADPEFSPDGSQIAFTGEYDGNVDVYVLPASGGVPRRLTWHPASDTVLGWTPDGKKVLFSSNRTSYSRFSKLFTVALDGGLEEELPLPMGFEASYSADGAQLAYVPIRRAFYGNAIEAARRLPSGSRVCPTAGWRRCRVTTPTTSTRCGPTGESGSSRTATAP